MCQVDDAGCQRLLDWSQHRILSVASLVQADPCGVQRNHDIVMVDAEFHRIGRAGLLKPAEIVDLLQAGDDCLFDDGLAVRDAEQLGLERPAALDRKCVLFPDVIFKRDFANTLEQLLKAARLKPTEHQLDTLCGAQADIGSGNHIFFPFKGDSAVGYFQIFAAHPADFGRQYTFQTKMAGC